MIEVELRALVTSWSGTRLPVEPVTLVSPLYVAMTLWEPAASELVGYCAWPATTRTGAVSIPSILKVTVPVAVPEPGTEIVAVKVTSSPTCDGLRLLVTTGEDVAWLIASVPLIRVTL